MAIVCSYLDSSMLGIGPSGSDQARWNIIGLVANNVKQF